MRLVLSDVAAAPLEALAAELDAAFEVCDVGAWRDVDRLARRAADLGAPLGAVFANAGVMKAACLEETSPEDWAFLLHVNVLGVAHMIRSFLPVLRAQASPSRFVATASVAGLVSAPMSGAYNACKHAVVALCETLHQEVQDRAPQVGVSVICPGAVKTDILNLARYGVSQGHPETEASLSKLMAKAGISADELVTRSLSGLEEGKFWIFPQNYVFERFQARCEAIFNQSDPRWLPKS